LSKIPIIAVVDDDEAIRDALADLLMVEGFDCKAFDGASSFLAQPQLLSFGCLITDMRMPGMSGLELLEHLHGIGSTMPVIVLTSVIDEHRRQQSLALGAHAWLFKPVANDVLLNELKSALRADGGCHATGFGT